MTQPTRKKSFARRLLRIVLKTVLFIFLFLVLVVLLLLTPPVQSFIRKKAVTYLENKLHTKVAIGRLYVGLPKKIIIEGVYIEDRQKDTLLYAGSLKANIGILKLIFKGEVNFDKIELKNSTVKIKRQLPDTTFNFQFIIDAFNPKKEKKTPTDTTSSDEIAIHKVQLDKIRFIYRDTVTGNDVTTWLEHFDTKIDKIDPSHLHFDIPEANINGLVATIYQSKPLSVPETPAKDKAEASEPVNLRLDLKKIGLQNIQFVYRNDVSAVYSSVNLGEANIKVKKFDLAHQRIELDNFSLANTNAGIRLGKKEASTVVVKEAKKEIQTRVEAGWQILASVINIDNNNLFFENDNEPKEKTGMDYAHLKADSLTLHAKDFVFGDSIGANITEARLKEQSGFVLEKLQTKFLYTDKQAYLQDLYIKTPGTELKRNAAIRYASIESLKTDIGDMQLDADIQNSKVLVKDILTFVPSLRSQPAFADPNTTWYINSRIKGRVADMQIDALQIQGLRDTKIDIRGSLVGLPDMKNVAANLTIREISSTKRDIELFMPANSLPKNITLPGRINITGRANGQMNRITTDVAIRTDLGSATVKGEFQQLADPAKMIYDASVQTTSLDLGTILQQKETFGTVTASFTAKGKGMDPKTAEAVISGKIQSATFKQYVYRDLTLKGSIVNQLAKVDAGIIDPNIHFTVNAQADFSKEYPAVVVKADIDSIKTSPLHLTSNTLIYRGKIEGNFPVTDPSNLQGTLFITKSLFIQEGRRVQLDSIKLIAGVSDSGHYLIVSSDIVNAELKGQYELTSLGDIFLRSIQPYFAIKGVDSTKSLPPYDFRLTASLVNSASLKTILPGLERVDSVVLQTHFSDKNGWNALLTAPVIDIGSNRIRKLRVEAGTNADKLNVKASLQQLSISNAVELDNTSITASMANNSIDFILNIKDKSSKDKYNLEGKVQQPGTGNYMLSLQQKNLLLNYAQWNISADNKLIFSNKNINASNFVLSRSGQQLKITSQSQSADAPMDAEFTNFKLATLTGLVQTDTTFAMGVLNGKLSLIETSPNPVFTSDLTIDNLRLKDDTVGNVHLIVNNKVSDTYNADITITGRGNDVKLAGNYYPNSTTNNFDFTLDIRQMPMTTAEAFSNGAIRNASGSLNGKFAVRGTLSKPSINGDLNFNKSAFTFSSLNSKFTIDQEKIEVNNNGLRFNNFAVKDSAGNQLLINGTASTTNFSDYKFDMTLRANDFHALSSTKKDNKIFYGQLYFNTNLSIKGTDKLPAIDGRIVVNEKTKMTVVLPQREPGVVEREGIIEFVDMDAPLEDSLFLASVDSLLESPFRGMEVSVTIEVDKEADLTLVVDEGNGDFLNVKGEALLSATVDRSGKIFLAGTYELESGAYELSFNLLRRKFEIQKGSKIVWEGEPTKANVDITAKYVANVAPLDLVKSQLDENITASQRNTYLQRIPFDVVLKMEGELLQPKITFDILLPENKTYIVSNEIITTARTRLEQLRQEEGEMNKQIFSLLLLNRFVAENPFSSSSGTSASTLARQSVSKLMTEQLNRLATELVKGVDINFDIESSEDYTTGERADRTELNVGLSKKLLNDRLTVTVGSNFELEGPQNSNQQSNNIAGNVALDYKLSKDGRYLLRAYRKNEYQGIIDGYVIETGVGFVITLDYNRFREIFQGRKKREQLRQQRLREQQVPANDNEKKQTTQATEFVSPKKQE